MITALNFVPGGRQLGRISRLSPPRATHYPVNHTDGGFGEDCQALIQNNLVAAQAQSTEKRNKGEDVAVLPETKRARIDTEIETADDGSCTATDGHSPESNLSSKMVGAIKCGVPLDTATAEVAGVFECENECHFENEDKDVVEAHELVCELREKANTQDSATPTAASPLVAASNEKPIEPIPESAVAAVAANGTASASITVATIFYQPRPVPGRPGTVLSEDGQVLAVPHPVASIPSSNTNGSGSANGDGTEVPADDQGEPAAASKKPRAANNGSICRASKKPKQQALSEPKIRAVMAYFFSAVRLDAADYGFVFDQAKRKRRSASKPAAVPIAPAVAPERDSAKAVAGVEAEAVSVAQKDEATAVDKSSSMIAAATTAGAAAAAAAADVVVDEQKAALELDRKINGYERKSYMGVGMKRMFTRPSMLGHPYPNYP